MASFREAGGSADPPRIVKCKSFALSVSSKAAGVTDTDRLAYCAVAGMPRDKGML